LREVLEDQACLPSFLLLSNMKLEQQALTLLYALLFQMNDSKECSTIFVELLFRVQTISTQGLRNNILLISINNIILTSCQCLTSCSKILTESNQNKTLEKKFNLQIEMKNSILTMIPKSSRRRLFLQFCFVLEIFVSIQPEFQIFLTTLLVVVVVVEESMHAPYLGTRIGLSIFLPGDQSFNSILSNNNNNNNDNKASIEFDFLFFFFFFFLF
jgi:hypothetical protein